MKPRLDRWVIHGNVLVGYLFDHPKFRAGQRVKTDAVVEMNALAREARCLDGDYRLGDQGTAAEHNQPLLSQKHFLGGTV